MAKSSQGRVQDRAKVAAGQPLRKSASRSLKRLLGTYMGDMRRNLRIGDRLKRRCTKAIDVVPARDV